MQALVHSHYRCADGFFELSTQPKKALVIGGGYIAVELAGVLNALGSKVSLMNRHNEVWYGNKNRQVL